MRLGCLELRWPLVGRPAVEREDTDCIEMACMIALGSVLLLCAVLDSL